MYAPSELLAQVKKQVKAEFGDQITSFEWFYEEEYTTIIVEIRETAMLVPVETRIDEIVNEIVGDGYIVVISLTSIESVGATDGLFNLRFNGGINVFFIEYYAPERPTEKPFRLTAYYSKMFEAVRTIHFDSPDQLWRRLVSPAREVLAKQKGFTSFRREILAADLRDFLIEHLDFIKHIAEASRLPLHIFEPTAPTSTMQSSNGTQPKQSERPSPTVDSPASIIVSATHSTNHTGINALRPFGKLRTGKLRERRATKQRPINGTKELFSPIYGALLCSKGIHPLVD